jgi:hypothetical protein
VLAGLDPELGGRWRMKNAEKPKKMQKKVAQKTLKEKRSEKKAKENAR